MKYTKRQYKKDIAAATAALERANDYFARINDFVSNYLDRHAADQKPEPAVLGNIWERADAAKRACVDRVSEIEDRYIRRNWTFSDYQFREMVTNNID